MPSIRASMLALGTPGRTLEDAYWDMFKAIFEEPQLLFEPLKQTVQIAPFFQMHRSSLIGVSQQVQENHLVALLESTL